MPKVMMIGKVSPLGRKTRKAGSFKGMLGTVVLEGSRAQSRRYGMGNIAGSPREHKQAYDYQLAKAEAALREARKETTCARRVHRALVALQHATGAGANAMGMQPKPHTGEAHTVARAAFNMIEACVPPPKPGTVQGARPRRRR
jgi:hypothetical protein